MGGRKDLSLNVRFLLSFSRLSRLIRYSVVEINTGLICGCMPVMKPFFKRIVSKPRPHQTQQPFYVRSNSIWMGKCPDDLTRCNYRNFIELEGGKSNSDGSSVHAITEEI